MGLRTELSQAVSDAASVFRGKDQVRSIIKCTSTSKITREILPVESGMGEMTCKSLISVHFGKDLDPVFSMSPLYKLVVFLEGFLCVSTNREMERERVTN